MFRKISLTVAATFLLVMGVSTIPVSANSNNQLPVTKQCPGSGWGDAPALPHKFKKATRVNVFNKYDVLPAGTYFCIKGGQGNTGILKADGQTTLQQYLEQHPRAGKQIFHYLVYKKDHTRTDVCPNLPGKQRSIPDGYELNDRKKCVEIPEEPQEPETPVTPGVVLGDDTQVDAPVGGVEAGAGGGNSANGSALAGLIGSLVALGAGVLRLRGVEQ